MRFPRLLLSMLGILALALPSNAQAVWQILSPQQSPPPNSQWTAAFDEARGEAILVFPTSGSTNQGWRWNGSTWSQMSLLPPDRFGCYMVYDVARERIVLWGGVVSGSGGSQFHQDLWEWDGSIWQQRTAAMPPGRRGAAVAYDRSREVAIMFGGSNQNGLLQDTWEWNGVAWSNPNPSVRPSAREGAAMAFDPSANRVLLYGGSGTVQTWSWDGSTWQQHSPTTPPYLRLRPMMVADLFRARVVLQGGTPSDAQTWEWDGLQWHASMPGSPGTLFGAGCVYDTQRREVVLHGGDAFGLGNTNLTWAYRTLTPAVAVAFGTGCAGSAGVPTLEAAPYSSPWIGDAVRTVASGLAASSPGALFVTSFMQSFLPMSMAPIGAPGCDLLLPPDVLAFEVASGAMADWTLAIPANTALAGVSIYQQAFPFELGVNSLGMIASNGLRLVVGIR